MLQNSMDSLSEAIDYYIKGKKYADERCYKFCIFMLYHSTELILKEILLREHKVLICEKIDDYKNTGTMKTIGFKTALSRVQNICQIDLGRYYTYLDDMAEIRNEIQHYKISIDATALNKIIISSFSAIEYLVYNILNTRFDDFGDLITQEQIEELHGDKEAYNNRKNDIRADVKSKQLVKVSFEYSEGRNIDIPCPRCSETFLVYDNSLQIKCLFCNEKYGSIDELYNNDKNCIIHNFMERELGRREALFDELLECSWCNYRTLIFGKSNSKWKCASCGHSFSDDEVRDYQYMKGKEDWKAEVSDMMEDPHYSHLWK
jgi:ribosomal protein S27E